MKEKMAVYVYLYIHTHKYVRILFVPSFVIPTTTCYLLHVHVWNK